MLIVLIIEILTIARVNGEIYTAISDMDTLLETYGSFIASLEHYLEEQNRRLKVLSGHLTRCKDEHKKMQTTPDYMTNPINAFVTIKGLTKDLDYIQNYTCETKIVKSYEVVFPTEEDLQGAVDGFWRLQHTYNLNTKHLADGKLLGNFSHGNRPFAEKTTPPTSADCFELGIKLYQSGNHKPALEWLLESYNKYKQNTETDFSIDESNLVDIIRKIYYEKRDYSNALHWAKKLIILKPEIEELAIQIRRYEEELAEESLIGINVPDQIEPSSASHNKQNSYAALCRGEIPLSNYIVKNLKCYYMSGPEPFLKLARIKTEQLLNGPDVIMFHDIVSDNEIKELLKLAKERNFQRSTIRHPENGNRIPSNHRISKNSWVKDKHSLVASMTQRISDFTGLSMTTAEELQIANYGIGGYYASHYDYIKKNDHDKFSKYGNRIATVLFYLTDVEQGGATVFVKSPGLTVFPVKRSAIFWYNLLPSGEYDLRTLHAACPVLKGSKWVANKWIREFDQEFRRPCT